MQKLQVTHIKKQTFEQWLDALANLAISRGQRTLCFHRDYPIVQKAFRNGMTPAEALRDRAVAGC